MTPSSSARLALWVLDRLAHRNEALAGDLTEQFHAGRSSLWLWWQLLCAAASGSFREPRIPAALNLSGLDPVVLEWMVSRSLSPRRVNLGSPGGGVGGLGIMLLALHLTTVVPEAWWFVFGGMFGGAVLGSFMAFQRRDRPLVLRPTDFVILERTL